MRRTTLTLLLLVGIGLIVAPLSMSMFSRSSDGAKMVSSFKPTMQPASVKTTAMYYNDVFTPLRRVVPLMTRQNMDKVRRVPAGHQGHAGRRGRGSFPRSPPSCT
jgi:hypothetical protein